MRLSATDLESWRYFTEDDVGYLDKAGMIRRLLRLDSSNEKMEAGTAFHEFLEKSPPGSYSSVSSLGFDFKLKLSEEIAVPQTREIKTERQLVVSGMPVTLVCKADAVHGLTVYDHKLTGAFDPEKYIPSMQWRAYLMAFGCDRFVYNCFTGRKLKDGWAVSALDQLEFFRYDRLEHDVMRCLKELVDFVVREVPEKITCDDYKNVGPMP